MRRFLTKVLKAFLLCVLAYAVLYGVSFGMSVLNNVMNESPDGTGGGQMARWLYEGYFKIAVFLVIAYIVFSERV